LLKQGLISRKKAISGIKENDAALSEESIADVAIFNRQRELRFCDSLWDR
jgi:hypothetical protein